MRTTQSVSCSLWALGAFSLFFFNEKAITKKQLEEPSVKLNGLCRGLKQKDLIAWSPLGGPTRVLDSFQRV